MSCFKIADGVGNVTQWVTSIDDRGHAAGVEQFFHPQQILLVRFRQYVPQFLPAIP